MITLYRGDDTGGQLGKNVKIAFHCDDAVDMDGVTVKFNLLNVITKEWTNVHDGDILEMFVTHEQSGRLPLGFLFGKIWGEDSSGKVRTFANRLPIIVTHDLRKVYGSDGLDSQDIHVYSSVDWDAIANKPALFPSKIELVEGLTEALDGMVKSVNGKTADAAGAVTLTLDSFANKDGEIQVKQTLMVSRDGGQTFNAVATLVDVWNEIDNHNSSATAHANLMAAIANTYARKSTTYTKTEVDDRINQLDIPSVSTTFTSADAGKAADAKAVGEALKRKLDWFTLGQGATLEFSDDFMYFSNSYGANSIFYPNSVGNPEKDSELAHDGMEISATRVWINWFLAQDETKAALFAGADFSRACAYKIVTVGADGMMTDRAINATSASSVTVPDDYTDLLIRASVTGSLSVTVPDGVTKYGDAFPAEAGEYIVTITKLATGEAFVKTLKLEVANA